MPRNEKRSAAALSQYEPLTTPQKWSGDEKRFALRLTQLMDQLFDRLLQLGRRVAALEERMEQEESNG